MGTRGRAPTRRSHHSHKRLRHVSRGRSLRATSRTHRSSVGRFASNRHAPAHIHVRANPAEPCLGAKALFERVPFPTAGVSLEAILRLLIDDFGVPANEPGEVWRPLLQETEQAFMEIARQPQARGAT